MAVAVAVVVEVAEIGVAGGAEVAAATLYHRLLRCLAPAVPSRLSAACPSTSRSEPSKSLPRNRLLRKISKRARKCRDERGFCGVQNKPLWDTEDDELFPTLGRRV